MEKTPRILFFTLTNIGDVVLSTVLLERVVKRFPQAEVDVVCGPRAAELLAGLSQLRRLIPLHKQPRRGHYKQLYWQLKNERYDYIFDLRGSALSWALKGEHKVVNRSVGKGHKADQCAALCPWEDPRPLQQLIAPDAATMAKVKCPEAPYFILAPTANWIGKRWPQGHFAALYDQLVQLPQLKNHRVAVLAAPHERRHITDLLQHLPDDYIDLTNITLSEAYVWLQGAKLCIGHDSGLAHLAAAAKIPTVTIFGPMDETRYAPLNPQGRLVCPPIRPRREVNLQAPYLSRVVTDVTVEQVLHAAYQVLTATPEPTEVAV